MINEIEQWKIKEILKYLDEGMHNIVMAEANLIAEMWDNEYLKQKTKELIAYTDGFDKIIKELKDKDLLEKESD